jgi:predicted kinase
MRICRPVLIMLGGFAGTGKTVLSRRLSCELSIPRLGSDTIGRTIRTSQGISEGGADAYWMAYDVLFALCEEFLRSGVSTIIDLTLGWAFQWHHLDAIRDRHSGTLFLPMILRCPREVCIERIRQRYARDPAYYDPPGLYTTEHKLLSIWEFLERLDRPDVHSVDAARPQDEVYEDIKQILIRSGAISEIHSHR